MKLSARLPEQLKNGLGKLGQQMVDDPDATHLVVGYVTCVAVHIDHTTGNREPVAGFIHLEAIRPQDHGTAIAMVEAAYAARTTIARAASGEQPLPLEEN